MYDDDYDDYDDYEYDHYYNDDYDWMPQPTIWQKIKTWVRRVYWRIRNKITGELDDISF